MWALQDITPRIPEVSFDQFKSALLPHVENTKFEQVYDVLKREGELSDEGWVGFDFDKRMSVQGHAEQSGQGQGTPVLDAVQEPRQISKHQLAVAENELHKPLAEKFNKVLEHTRKTTGKPPLITFSSNPNQTLKSEDEHGPYIADINALLVDTTAVGDQAGKEKFECDIVMTGEFTEVVNDRDTDYNISKLIGNINHLMGFDPTRRFVYGMTIEHTETRFWFCSRSHIFVTENLDLQKNAKEIIYFVMALGSASKEQLGFDPTVRRAQRGTGDKSTRYRYTINGIEYETLEAISIYKAMFLLGSANRIFKVQRVVNDELVGPVLVLKDLWLPEGAKTELEIQQYIKANVNKVHVVEGLDAADFEKHFVAIQHCEIVKVPSMVNANEFVDDNSTNFLRRNDLSRTKKFALKLVTTQYPQRSFQSQMSDSGGSLPLVHRADTEDICMLARENYRNKAHHRIVMEDAGCPLQDVCNLRTVMACIGKASTGLSFMFSAGMVHRDISTGNLLVSEVGGELVCKITDLEYAKKVGANSQSPQDNKTGTPYFMASEICAGHYLFRPQESPPRLPISGDFVSMMKSRIAARRARMAVTRAALQYNYLHDLESLFWILMYFLLAMHPLDSHVSQPDIYDRMRRFYELFSDFDTSSRIEFLQGNPCIQTQLISSVPPQFVSTMRFAITFSNLLRMEYKRVEALPDSTTDKYSAKPYKQLQSAVAKHTNCKEKHIWLGDMFDMSERMVRNVERTIQAEDPVDVPRKRPAEEVSGGLSIREGNLKRSRQGE